ncbi:MAG: hypothetical protein HY403_06640 [Elusimicrobia bacterium]|nr:hypothetical protein [Elusimicrobiota bacterium]
MSEGSQPATKADVWGITSRFTVIVERLSGNIESCLRKMERKIVAV